MYCSKATSLYIHVIVYMYTYIVYIYIYTYIVYMYTYIHVIVAQVSYVAKGPLFSNWPKYAKIEATGRSQSSWKVFLAKYLGFIFQNYYHVKNVWVTVSDALHSFNLCTRTCERLGYTLIVHKVNQLKLCW